MLVLFDEASIRASGKFPFDRQVLAAALQRLGAAGAQRIFLDATLAGAEDDVSDRALETALADIGPSRLAVLSGSLVPGSQDFLTRPITRFSPHVTVAGFESVRDSDLNVRRILQRDADPAPSAGLWLARGESPSPMPSQGRAEQGLDLRFDPHSLPRVSVMDLMRPEFDAARIRGSLVILGLDAFAGDYEAPVPLHGLVSHPELVGLSAATELAPHKLVRLSLLSAIPLTLALTALVAVIVAPINFIAGLAWLAGFSLAWFEFVVHVLHETGILVPVLPPILSCLIVWQALSFQQSPVMTLARRLWQNLLGVREVALASAIDVMADPALVFDKCGRVVATNAPMRYLVGNGRRAGKPITRLEQVLADESARMIGILAQAPLGGSTQMLEIEGVNATGVERSFQVSIAVVQGLTGRLGIATFKDVTRARERERELTKLAFRDGLTGLANRIALRTRLASLESAPRREPFALLLVDLDGFKKVNDSLGHHAGDLLLKQVADRIQAVVAPDDLAARLGGDEFDIACCRADEISSNAVARAIICELTRPFDLEGARAEIGGSIGIAMWPYDDERATEVLKKADLAMYAAKQQKPAIARYSQAGPLILGKLA